MSEEKSVKQNKDTAVVSAAKDDHHKPKSDQSFWRRPSTWVVVLLFVLVGAGLAWAKAATTTYSLWADSVTPKTISDPDTSSVELGTRFQSKYAGQVTGVKFYKSAQNTGTHTGSLWDTKGDLLATVTFTNETASGWQTATFPQPINIAANVNYIISYHAPKGHYSDDTGFFDHNLVNGPLIAAKASTTSPNGVYVYSSGPAFPTQSYNNSSYYVDVIYQTNLINPTAKPAPPTTVTAVQKGNSIVVTWNAAISQNLLIKYRIYRNGQYVLGQGTSTLTYTDTNITAGQTYSYQIKSVDTNNTESVLSQSASVTYNAVPPPTCPPGYVGTPPNCTQSTGSGGSTGGSAVACALSASAGRNNLSGTETPQIILGSGGHAVYPSPTVPCWAQHTGALGYATDVGTPWTNITGADPNITTIIDSSIIIVDAARAPSGQGAGVYAFDNSTPYNLPSGIGAKLSSSTSLSHAQVNGCVAIASANVTLTDDIIAPTSAGRNSCPVRVSGFAVTSAGLISNGNDNGGYPFGNLTLKYVTFQGFAPNSSSQGPCASTLHDVLVTNSSFGYCGDLIHPLNNFEMDESYLHDTYDFVGSGNHADDVQIFCGSGTPYFNFKHNWIGLNPGSTGASTAALNPQGEDCSGKLLVDSNFLQGDGGTDMNGPATPLCHNNINLGWRGGPGSLVITNNVFATTNVLSDYNYIYNNSMLVWSGNHHDTTTGSAVVTPGACG